MKLHEQTWPDVERYLQSKKSIFIPVGSTEQHGPTGPLGIDWVSSWRIAEEAGRRSQTLVTPSLSFGMAQHHMAFPGTISLTPSTYVMVVKDIVLSLSRHGFRKLVFINGHGGNIAPLTTAFCESMNWDEPHDIQLINWWHQPEVTDYENEVFGDENGFHATCGEISLIMHTDPQCSFGTQKTFAPTVKNEAWPLPPVRFREKFPDGRMQSNPALCSAEHGKKIFERAVQGVLDKARL